MKVVRLADSGQTPMLVQDDAPQPRPGPGELLVRVRAAGVIPTELGWYPTSHTKTGEKRILKRCTYPLTATACVKRVYTDLAVIDVTDKGFVVRDTVAGLSLDELQALGDAELRAG